jgi:hypothetical protein
MKLYHFTGLAALVGAEGLAAMESALEDGRGDCDANAFAVPGSILMDGVRPSRDDSYDGLLRSPLPPCVGSPITPTCTASVATTTTG